MRRIIILFFVFNSIAGYAQLDNSPFYDYSSIDTTQHHQIDFHIDYWGINKDNEYFNPFVDGYTLFGNQLLLRLAYQPSPHLKFEAGIFGHKDFGNQDFSQVQPFLRFKYKKEHFSFLFGTIEGNLSHQLIEPLFDFERIAYQRLENGMQVKYEKPRLFADAWIHWKKMIYDNSPYQEDIEGGFSLSYTLQETEKWNLKIPLQFTGFHRGGQIDTDPDPLVTIFNGAIGAEWSMSFAEASFVKTIQFKNYLTGYLDYSFSYEPLFNDGNGIYLNAFIDTHKGGLMLSYWNGTEFLSSMGGDIYSSESRRINPPIRGANKRELLIIRLLNTIHLGKKATLLLRTEPYYDFNLKRADFSLATYLVFNDIFSIGKKKH